MNIVLQGVVLYGNISLYTERNNITWKSSRNFSMYCYMLIVSDTTPLISLLKACQIGLLQRMFGKIIIPDAVKILRNVTGLDAGESEAIVLMDERKADLLLIDEHKGRQVAKQIGMTLTGTIGIFAESL